MCTKRDAGNFAVNDGIPDMAELTTCSWSWVCGYLLSVSWQEQWHQLRSWILRAMQVCELGRTERWAQ